MSDTKKITLEDGTPVPEDLQAAYIDCQAGIGDFYHTSCFEYQIRLIERIARAEAREKRLREALEAIKYALSDERPLGVPGWKPARDYLDVRDIYNDDLNDLRVLFEVARAALNDKEEGTMSSESAEDKLQRIRAWCDAYPLEFFEEPDMQEIRTRLGDKLLSELSAHNFRHVLRGISAIIGEDKEEGQ